MKLEDRPTHFDIAQCMAEFDFAGRCWRETERTQIALGDCHALGNLIDQHEVQNETFRCVKLKANAAQRSVDSWAHLRVVRSFPKGSTSNTSKGKKVGQENSMAKTSNTSPNKNTSQQHPVPNANKSKPDHIDGCIAH